MVGKSGVWRGLLPFLGLIVYTFIGSYGVEGLSCSKVVTTRSHGLLDYLAHVSFPAPISSKGNWKLEMVTDIPYTFMGGWGVRVQDFPEQGKAIFKSAKQVNVKRGQRVKFSFRILYAHEHEIPKVKKITWNDRVICENTQSRRNNLARRRYRNRNLEFSAEDEENALF